MNKKELWNESFKEQISSQAYNTSPVESLIRNVAYYLRARYSQKQYKNLHFLELGCGAGPNLIWLAQKGINVTGVDISDEALKLCQQNLENAGGKSQISQLIQSSVENVPLPDNSFDGIVEACVFQHLDKDSRVNAFQEVFRLLKTGGLFAGYMLSDDHTVFNDKKKLQSKDDPGTLNLQDGKSKFYLTNLGVSHFFNQSEIKELLNNFTHVDCCEASFEIPQEEAKRRGYSHYKQGMYSVFAIK